MADTLSTGATAPARPATPDTVQLKSPDHRQPYSGAYLRTREGNVLLWIRLDRECMGFGLDLTPVCTRELAAALLAQADQADAAGQKGGAA